MNVREDVGRGGEGRGNRSRSASYESFGLFVALSDLSTRLDDET